MIPLAQIDPGPWTQFGPIGAVVIGLITVVYLFLKFLGKHIDANTLAQQEVAKMLGQFTHALQENTRVLERLFNRSGST